MTRLSGARLVAHALHGEDDFRPLRIWFDLGAQPLHVHVDQSGVGRVPIAPDLLQQHLAGEDLTRLASERDQQVELNGVSFTSSSLRLTVWAGTSMVIWLPGGPMVSISGATSSPRRNRARIRATSSLGLNGLTT